MNKYYVLYSYNNDVILNIKLLNIILNEEYYIRIMSVISFIFMIVVFSHPLVPACLCVIPPPRIEFMNVFNSVMFFKDVIL